MARTKKSEGMEVHAGDITEQQPEQPKLKLTPIRQVKLAVSIPKTTSQTLMDDRFSLLYDADRMVLYVQAKNSKDQYVIHASNIAYLKI
jgi:hypothetical protein